MIGIVTAFLAGSRLFVTLEGCFGIVFRLRGRDLLRQNRMAFGMLLLFLLIVPLVFLISIVPAGLVTLIDPHGQSPLGGLLGGGARLIILFAASLLFFGAIYAFVPNRRMRWHTWGKNWHGTVVAAVLLVLYELLFRVYQAVSAACRQLRIGRRFRHRDPAVPLLCGVHPPAGRRDQFVGGGAARDGGRPARHAARGTGASHAARGGGANRRHAERGDASATAGHGRSAMSRLCCGVRAGGIRSTYACHAIGPCPLWSRNAKKAMPEYDSQCAS